ncbi:MAG: CBS domain-containing protein [Candidatus Hydrothermarchaeales archaeon]
MKLTSVQREVLMTLMDIFRRSEGEAIKGDSIAQVIGKNPGTIRNQMQSLKALGLVDGVPGPKGGYKPTLEAYETLGFEKLEEEAVVPIYLNDILVDNLSVTSINFRNLTNPEKCRAEVHMMGNLKGLEIGDVIRIGPTPLTRLTIKGKVLGRDDMKNILLIDVITMASIPKGKAIKLANTDVKVVYPETTIRDAAQLLIVNKIHGAPVVIDGKPIGAVTTFDITKALTENREDAQVKEIMSINILLINEETQLPNALEEMDEQNISRIFVVDDENKLKGVVTRTDILCRLNDLCKCNLD